MKHFVNPDSPAVHNRFVPQRAACWALVHRRDIASTRGEVECPKCLAWLTANDADEAPVDVIDGGYRIKRNGDVLHVERIKNDSVVCPNCYGSGEVVRHDGSDTIVYAPCLECGATGLVTV